jgi:hypothetical protein
VRASPPSCESITRSRWVGFCYSCASAPFPAGLFRVPWTGKSCRAPRTPLRSPLRPSHRCRARGLLAPADPSNRCNGRVRVASFRVARSESRASEALKEAGWLRATAPSFRLPLSPSPSALPVPARFIRRNPAPPSRPPRARALPPVRRAHSERLGRCDPSRLPCSNPAGSPCAPSNVASHAACDPGCARVVGRAPWCGHARGPVPNAPALPAWGEVSGGGLQGPPLEGRVGQSEVQFGLRCGRRPGIRISHMLPGCPLHWQLFVVFGLFWRPDLIVGWSERSACACLCLRSDGTKGLRHQAPTFLLKLFVWLLDKDWP